MRLEPDPLLLDERGNLPGCLLKKVVLKLSFVVGDVVTVHVVGDKVSFAARQQLLLRVRDRVRVIVVLGWGADQDAFINQPQEIIDIIW